MPTRAHRSLRLARRGLVYAMAIVLVLVALVLGVASQVLPLAERHPERIEAWLSQRAGRPIGFDRVQTEWTRRGPLLQLDNLRIGEGDEAFTIGDTEMLVSIYAGLLPGTPFSELRLRGLDLTLERAADGRWQVRGLPGQQKAGVDPFEALEGLGELQVIDGRLSVRAPALGIDADIPRIDLRLQVSGNRVRAGVRAWPEAAARSGTAVPARPIDAVLDLQRDSGDGRVHLGADQVDLGQWSSLLKLMGVSVVAGSGRAEAWATLEGNRVSMVTLDTELDRLVLAGAPLNSAAPPPRTGFGRLQARARWQLLDSGWRLDAPELRIERDGQRHVLDGVLLAGGSRYALAAEKLDIAPLVDVAALSDRLTPTLRRWLLQARPHAVLEDIEMTGRRGGAMQARARIDGFGFQPVGDTPGLDGLTASFEGDSDGFDLQFDPARPVSVDWPPGFGQAHVVTLDGNVAGWRQGSAWEVGTAALSVDGEGFGADLRGRLSWQDDGSRPRLDLAASLDPLALPIAKGFLVRHRMPPKVLEWLDTALVAGTLQQGRALVAGDLDDWPFADATGRFEASGHLADATLRFHPDWPAAEHIEADVGFIGNGFNVDGSGTLGDLAIGELSGGIDNYHGGQLTVTASGGGDASGLVALLRNSPLRRIQPETFDSLRASGAAEVDFRLRLPLQRGRRMAIDGDVALTDAMLADPRWDLAFDRVNGRIAYTHTGFHADRLQARHDGRPATLGLRAGEGHVRTRSNSFEADLRASLDADDLIDRAADLAWLKPQLDGRSRWDVGVVVPKAASGKAVARLQLQSDLVGTALTLPEPLRKAAATPLAASIDTPLPVGNGDVVVRLGEVMALRAGSANGRTGVRIALGSDRVQQPAPASGLVASGRADKLDAIAWLGLVRGGSGSGGNNGGTGRLPLQRIDVTARRLQLLGGVFPDTRLLVLPASDGATTVRAEGARLQGDLRVPPTDGAAISGRFQRVHWRGPVTAATATTSPTATPPATRRAAGTPGPSTTSDDLDPAAIPPLSFDIDDLRLKDAQLGSAKIRTRPTAAGLVVEQLVTRAPGQSIDATGSWIGRGDNARTRISATVDSDDFGALLAGFGYGGRLAGGEGQARFDAGWQGSPAGFNVAGLDGNLTVAARDGRLLEVEPGAGRVFGLLSIAELPRRLSLDFRDFFAKGFAFNKISGGIRFDAGTARSDHLQIDGPAAEINIRGAADLRNETFNQTIEVLPKAGNLLTAVGAIAGGPVGAAIGAAANAVLQKPLGIITARTYRVTGPWDDPKVEVISRDQGRSPPAAAKPAG